MDAIAQISTSEMYMLSYYYNRLNSVVDVKSVVLARFRERLVLVTLSMQVNSIE
jgi:hypothetical protein